MPVALGAPHKPAGWLILSLITNLGCPALVARLCSWRDRVGRSSFALSGNLGYSRTPFGSSPMHAEFV